MRRVIRLELADVRPDETDVLLRLGVPEDAPLNSSVRALLADAAARLDLLAEPIAVVHRISPAAFAEVYRGEGRNAAESPLDAIYPRADRLALFVATLGELVGPEIAGVFATGDPASALALDAFASAATNRIADELARGFERELGDSAAVLPYSPGYCGWHVTGQRALFDVIKPADIGVSLNTSCLMTPIKSVSGVLVAGSASIHRFRPKYDFCNECATHDCVPRMRSVNP
jgi:Vitamin B12 dependent methionine synthase, activation domain